jgi:ABC-type antimicrobial peptide transport system permease subunit
MSIETLLKLLIVIIRAFTITGVIYYGFKQKVCEIGDCLNLRLWLVYLFEHPWTILLAGSAFLMFWASTKAARIDLVILRNLFSYQGTK